MAQINVVKETAEKAELHASLRKTEYNTNIENVPKQFRSDYGKIARLRIILMGIFVEEVQKKGGIQRYNKYL